MIFLAIVTVTSMLVAAIMSVVAWRMASDERRRSEARVAALSAEIHETNADAELVLRDRPESPQVPVHPSLLAAHSPASGARPFAAFAIGVLAVGAVAAMAVVLPRMLMRAPGRAPSAAVQAAAEPPLELVALGHERLGDQLTVHGVIRNPRSAVGMEGLTAVVVIVAADGGVLASGHAAVEAPALQPGGEATFAVTVPSAGDAGRYRVSFRTGDRVVPHVDHRHEG